MTLDIDCKTLLFSVSWDQTLKKWRRMGLQHHSREYQSTQRATLQMPLCAVLGRLDWHRRDPEAHSRPADRATARVKQKRRTK